MSTSKKKKAVMLEDVMVSFASMMGREIGKINSRLDRLENPTGKIVLYKQDKRAKSGWTIKNWSFDLSKKNKKRKRNCARIARRIKNAGRDYQLSSRKRRPLGK